MNFKVRDFKQSVQGPVSIISGRISEKDYILTIDLFHHPIPIVEVGRDRLGTYALISEEKIDLFMSNYVLCIEADYTDIDIDENPELCDRTPGCQISFRREGVGEPLLPLSTGPPPEFSVSVAFSASGRVNGTGYSLTGMHDQSEIIN